MQFIEAITNPVVIVPAISFLTAQIIKALINALMNKKFSFARLIGDGGMPSGHSATVMALALMCGFEAGFSSVYFGIAAILAVIVMHDATGVRQETGKQAVAIIDIVTVVNEYVVEKDEEIKAEKLKVLVGHTPLQVVCGVIVGTVVAFCYFWIFKL